MLVCTSPLLSLWVFPGFFFLLASHPDPVNKSDGPDIITWKATNFQTHVKYQLFITSPYAARASFDSCQKSFSPEEPEGDAPGSCSSSRPAWCPVLWNQRGCLSGGVHV